MSEWCKKIYRLIVDFNHWVKHDERQEISEIIDRVEGHYRDIKTDLENIQDSIDPLKQMLLEMDQAFRKRNHQRDGDDVGE